MMKVIIVYSDDKNDIERMSENLRWPSIRKSKLCVFAEDKGKVIGASCIRGVSNISATYVSEEYRGQGIGAVLLKNAIVFAKRKNCRFVIGTVGRWGRDYNIPARKIVRKCGGFRKVADIDMVTIVVWPLETISGNLLFLCAFALFSLIPQAFRKKMVILAAQSF